MSNRLFSNGTEIIDCSETGEGVTLQTLVEMLQVSELDLPIRFDSVLISPTVVQGKLCIKLEVTERAQHADENEVMMLTSI